jgi:hypothetical protein
MLLKKKLQGFSKVYAFCIFIFYKELQEASTKIHVVFLFQVLAELLT